MLGLHNPISHRAKWSVKVGKIKMEHSIGCKWQSFSCFLMYFPRNAEGTRKILWKIDQRTAELLGRKWPSDFYSERCHKTCGQSWPVRTNKFILYIYICTLRTPALCYYIWKSFAKKSWVNVKVSCFIRRVLLIDTDARFSTYLQTI